MTDNRDSTLGSVEDAIDYFLQGATSDATGTDEAEIRPQIERLTLGVVYTWINEDRRAQEVFLDQLVDKPHRLGLRLAVDTLTTIRLFGIGPGKLKPGVEVTTACPHKSVDIEQRHYDEYVAVITDLWSGLASWDVDRTVAANKTVNGYPVEQLREVVRMMAFDVSVAIEQYADWSGVGADIYDEFRGQYPDHTPTPRPAPSGAVAPTEQQHD